jgi:predicted AAA+ superfamily ATPase
MRKYIKRSLYLDKISPYIDKNIIKVLTGQRRVGKSYLLYQLIDHIKETKKQANIIYINRELKEYSDIDSYNRLSEYIEDKSEDGLMNYVFIDEIQEIKEFEKSIRHFQASENYDIYITGSNAEMLSGELATYISGRYIEINIYGLTYNEFLQFHSLSDSTETLQDYLKYGGLPYLIHLDLNELVIFDYLSNIYASILYKDLIARYNIRNVQFLENLVAFLADNVGSIVSARKISSYLKSQQVNISTQVVLDYLNQLSSVFFINKVKRSSIKGKKIFEIGEKYYFEDIGIRNAIASYSPDQIHKIMENVVFLHLKACGFKVFVGTDNNKEVDFIGVRNNEKMYVQVTFRLTDPSTINREFGNLKTIGDNYPKMVVSLDDFFGGDNIEGIQHIHLRNFLKKYW